MPHQRGYALGIDPEGLGAAAHPHPRSAQIEIGVHPHREPGLHAQPLADRQRAGTLAFGFEVERDACGNRGFQIAVALAGPGKADLRRVHARCGSQRQLARRGDVDAIDQGRHQREHRRKRVGLHRVMD